MIYAGLYYFAFSYVFSARSGHEDNLINMAILFWGVSLHAYLSEILNRATTLISSNANYVKKIIFPLELLCLSGAITGLVQLVISTIITLIILTFSSVNIITILPAFFLLIPFVMICIGFSFLFSALGVFIKDLASLCSMLSSVLLFISPILYNLTMLPAGFQGIFYINPLTAPVQLLRELISEKSNLWECSLTIVLYSLAAIIFTFFTKFIFFKMKKYFVDVL